MPGTPTTHRAPGDRRVDDREAAERPTVEPAIPRQQAVGLLEGMGADQEVGDDPVPGTASPPIGAPGSAGPGGRPCVDRRVRDRECLRALGQRPRRRRTPPGPRPRRRRRRRRAPGKTCPQRRERRGRNAGSSKKMSSRTLVSTAVITIRRRPARDRGARGSSRRCHPRPWQDPDEVVEVIGEDQLPSDETPVGLLEVEHGPRPESESIAQPLRDGDLALLADGGLHTDMV